VATGVVTPPRGRIATALREVVVGAEWVRARAGRPGVALFDTRTPGEYLGTVERGGLRSEGHIAGARHIEWQQLFASADSGIFLSADAIAKLYGERSAPGDTIVTYCLVGYRASMTYFGARLLGLPVKIYDGSYQDWSRRSLPVKKGEAP
jgi:thiosulfate/3-mercaptopyruvate sulfurtransferase